MNILFLTENEISPMQGGTERITNTLSHEFITKGHNVGLAYMYPLKNLQPALFSYKINWDIKGNIQTQIENTITNNKVDVVICNYVRFSTKQQILPQLYVIANKNNCKVINCFHAMPGEDTIAAGWDNILYRIIHRYDLVQCTKDILLHILPSAVTAKRIMHKYRMPYDNCDKMVLLSDNFKEPYAKLARINDTSKFVTIPNSLSFDILNDIDISYKKKEVLVICRIHERSKRLSAIVNIWKEIEKDSKLNDWSLNIVGDGPDMGYLKKLVHKAKLNRLHILGRQPEIEPFYRSSAIFMMTSRFEGFGITLTEAQQFGVVPIAFHSYLSVTDIIDNKKNGIVVANNNIDAYISELKDLMLNASERNKMAIQANKDCCRFSNENIISKWNQLFEVLCQKSLL